MKKNLFLMLCLVLLVSLAACGNQETVGDSAVPAIQAESVTITAEEATQPEETTHSEETAEVIAEQPSTEPADDLPAFDTDWAGNAFEALLPQPPLGSLTGEQTSENRYQLSTEYDALDYYADSADYAALADYVASLENFGFRVYPTNYTNEEAFGAVLPNAWVALDTLGNRIDIELMITSFSEAGLKAACYITINCTSGEPVDTAALGGVFANLPDTVWTSTDEVTENAANLYTQFITYEAAAAYCDALLADGYTVAEEGEPYMSYIIKTFVSDDGCRIAVQYEGKEDFGICYITINNG